MSKNFVIHNPKGITYIKFTKEAELTDLLSAMDDIAARPDSDYRLWDMSNGVRLSGQDVTKVAEYGMEKFTRPGKSAIIAPENVSFATVSLGTVRHNDDLVEQQVFRSRQDAVAWLNRKK